MASSMHASRRNLLADSDSDSDDGGAAVGGFKINQEYANRFEHNKKREEKQRLEEKYKNAGDDEDDESSSDDETEDEDGFLATEDLDAQVSATLSAIRSKDPRIYDQGQTFYKPDDEAEDGQARKPKAEKALTLRDYQREKLLRGDVGQSDDEGEAPKTYGQEQADLKKSIISEINAEAGSDDDSSDDGFIKAKEPVKAAADGIHPSRGKKIKVSSLDIKNAEKDPENFLSNFMAARAWVPEEGGKWQAFESDDGEGDDLSEVEKFEEAYNRRFEDPKKSNEYLKSYSRDLTAKRSVRRDEKSGRQRQRELEREKKEAEKREREAEKARLRKLKLDETSEKLRKIKQAAGKSGKDLTDDEWIKFLDDAWDDDKWEEEMSRRFGDDYYAQEDDAVASDEEGGAGKKRKHPKKPTWDDDIDIKDLVPDFDDGTTKPDITLSDAEDDGPAEDDQDDDGEDGAPPAKKRKSSKKDRAEAQRKSKQERRKLEALVDAKLELTDHALLRRNAAAPAFRYRETSPQSFGMTARDILLAPSDQHLNEFAGLKKLATFRDEEKKRRDKKRLGKKARLREWRRDTFGKEYERQGPTFGFERVAGEGVREEDDPYAARARKTAAMQVPNGGEEAAAEGGRKKKRKRSKGKKMAEAAQPAEA